MPEHRKKLILAGISCLTALLLLCLCALLPGQFLLWPLLAMLALIPVAEEFRLLPGLALYAVTAVAALLLPILESALLFALVGYYPILRPRIEALSGYSLRTGIRILIVVISSTLFFAALRFFFGSELQQLTGGADALLLAILLLLGAVYFLLYNFILDRCTRFYHARLRPRLFPE